MGIGRAGSCRGQLAIQAGRQGLIGESLGVAESQQGDMKSQREVRQEPKSNCWGDPNKCSKTTFLGGTNT